MAASRFRPPTKQIVVARQRRPLGRMRHLAKRLPSSALVDDLILEHGQIILRVSGPSGLQALPRKRQSAIRRELKRMKRFKLDKCPAFYGLRQRREM